MENASKALLMAAGVLISLLIVSSFIFMYNHLKSLPKTQEKLLEEEQLIEFNKQYESYNRKNLKGTDVISVINKAIDSNAKYGEQYYVNVTFKLKNEVKDEVRKHESKKNGNKWQIIENPVTNIESFTLEKYKEYSIKNDTGKDNTGKDKPITKLVNNISETTVYCNNKGETENQAEYKKKYVDTIFEEEGKIYYTKNSAFVEFKRRTFECKSMEYTDSNTNVRRVCNIVFEEQ